MFGIRDSNVEWLEFELSRELREKERILLLIAIISGILCMDVDRNCNPMPYISC